jgi:hypothetical protein
MSLAGMFAIPRLEAKRGFVMPEQAGIHLRARCKANETWIPAPDQVRGRLYAGMTKVRVDFRSTNLEPLDLKPRGVQFILGSASQQGIAEIESTHSIDRRGILA